MRHTAPEDPAGSGRPGRRPRRPPVPPRPPTPPRRRVAVGLAVATLTLGATAILGQQVLLTPAGEQIPSARPLTGEEATRLAEMRALNHDEAVARVHATVGDGSAATRLTGWVDWRHPMVYLARSAPGGDRPVELIQAVPGLVAVHDLSRPAERPGPTGAAAPPAAGTGHAEGWLLPPPEPPTDGWRVRPPGGDGPPDGPADPGTADALATLLLTITAESPDAAGLLADSDARWLRRDRTAGYEVDVLLGPAVPPQTEPVGPAGPGTAAPVPERSLAAMGGAVRYWLDRAGRLHRLETLLSERTSVRVDLDRGEETAPVVADILGGAAVAPRPVSGEQARTLAGLRLRNREAGGGEVRLTMPGPDGEQVRAGGWLDWQRLLAYLATYRDGVPDGLMLADGSGVATRADLPPRAGMPPLPVPAEQGWQWLPWQDRADDRGGYDLDLLVNEALALSAWQVDDADLLREAAQWLRDDTLDGEPVGVYEIPREIESEAAPGEARLRYWVDESDGVLRRLEIRTRSGGWGQLDLTPGAPPPLR